MEAIFLRLASLAVTGGLVILGILLVRPLLRRAPKRLTCLLWIIAAVRLAIPAALKTPLGLLRTSTPVMQFSDGGVWLVWHHPLLDWYSAGMQYLLFYSHGFSAAVMSRLLTALGAVWLAGTVILLGYGMISTLRLRRQVAESVPLAGWKNVRVCDGLPSSFLLGLFHPVIYLPAALSETERQHVLAHETAHLRRRDSWWKALGFLLLALFWPNPLVWLGYRRFCRDLEFACDEAVVRNLTAEARKAYAETLLRCSAPKSTLTAPLAFGETGVKQRIRALAAYRRSARWVTALTAALCLLIGVCLATNFQPSAFTPDLVYVDDVKLNSPEQVRFLYGAFQAAEPAELEPRTDQPIVLTFREEGQTIGRSNHLELSLFPDGYMTFDPPDAYAGQQAARDNGELYRYAAEQSRRVGASAAQQD